MWHPLLMRVAFVPVVVVVVVVVVLAAACPPSAGPSPGEGEGEGEEGEGEGEGEGESAGEGEGEGGEGEGEGEQPVDTVLVTPRAAPVDAPGAWLVDVQALADDDSFRNGEPSIASTPDGTVWIGTATAIGSFRALAIPVVDGVVGAPDELGAFARVEVVRAPDGALHALLYGGLPDASAIGVRDDDGSWALTPVTGDVVAFAPAVQGHDVLDVTLSSGGQEDLIRQRHVDGDIVTDTAELTYGFSTGGFALAQGAGGAIAAFPSLVGFRVGRIDEADAAVFAIASTQLASVQLAVTDTEWWALAAGIEENAGRRLLQHDDAGYTEILLLDEAVSDTCDADFTSLPCERVRHRRGSRGALTANGEVAVVIDDQVASTFDLICPEKAECEPGVVAESHAQTLRIIDLAAGTTTELSALSPTLHVRAAIDDAGDVHVVIAELSPNGTVLRYLRVRRA